MNQRYVCVGSLIVLALCAGPTFADDRGKLARIDRDLCANWKFLRSDAPRAEAISFNDSGWRSVNLPFTWTTEVVGGKVTSYTGDAWYRCHLPIGPELDGKQLYLRFGAGSRVTEVYVNGKSAGVHRARSGPSALMSRR